MKGFFEELKEQRWDDHRFYHHSRVNQTLHLVSAMSFCATYVLLFTHPVFAVLFGWTFAMCIRQVGHFFFEPKGYDEENQATHEYKESVKVGYNLRRKVILHSLWAAVPIALYFSPTVFGIFKQPWTDLSTYAEHLARLWLVLAGGALLFRTVHLFFLRGVQTGLAWFTKILTDPFHDIYLYHRAPLYLLRGEMVEPAKHAA
jgi:predicted secreted protein